MYLEKLIDHIIWVAGTNHVLVEAGLIDRRFRITPEAFQAYQELVATSWSPDPSMVRSLLRADRFPDEQLTAITTLFMSTLPPASV